ncbi:MAG: hypothetical protein J6Y74_02905 [Clostridia bacterium]|nr:hypothetical protein [Clostridia bacterium]
MKKRFLSLILILILSASLALALFSCKDKPSSDPLPDIPVLAAEAVATALPESEEKEEIVSALLSLLDAAEIEDADKATILLLAKENDVGAALRALYTKDFNGEAKSQTEKALSLIANTVSADIAGDLFYAVEMSRSESLSYTREDCRKIANLYFIFYRDLGETELSALLQGDLQGLSARRVNTLLLSLASALHSMTGVSEGGKEYLRALALTLPEKIVRERKIASATAATEYLTRLINAVFRAYEPFLSYAAAFSSLATAETFLGVDYERREATLYYGYRYESAVATEISREDYEAKRGGYDAYFPIEKIVRGYTENGVFRAISDEKIELAEKAQKLNVTYLAYVALDDAEKEAFRRSLDEVLTVLKEDQVLTASFLGKSLHVDSNLASLDFDGLCDALRPLSVFNPRDGITDEELALARSAASAFERYMHSYLPNIY